MLKGKAKSADSQFEKCPAGNFPGVCVGIVDLGTHWESYQGGDERKQRKVLLVWQVDVSDTDAVKLQVIGRDFSIGYDKKGELVYGDKSHLRQLLENWRGRKYGAEEEIDLEAILNKPGQVNVVHEVKGDYTYAKVKAVTALGKGQKVHQPTMPPLAYSAESKMELGAVAWLPLVYGEHATDVIARCLEKGGTGRKPGKRPQNGAPASKPLDIPEGPDPGEAPF